MNVSLTNPAYKKCLLPLIIAVAVFFISQGISLPSFTNPEEPLLSASQIAKTSDSAFVKTLTKCSHVKAAKSSNSSALVANPVQTKAPVVLASDYPQQTRPFISAFVSVVPARAPPA
jgi:hypothetical protein